MTLPWVFREMEWHFGHRGADEPKRRLAMLPHGRATGGTWGKYGHLAARDATEGAFAAKKRHSGLKPWWNISAQD